MTRFEHSSETISSTPSTQGSSALHRELALLESIPENLVAGVKAHVAELKDHPGEVAGMLIGGLAVGAAFGYAARNPEAFGGLCGFLSRNSGKIGAATVGLDMTTRFGVPMLDTYLHANNLEIDKKALGANLGSAIIDYPLVGLSTYAGSGMSEAVNGMKSLSRSMFEKVGELVPDFSPEMVTTNGMKVRVGKTFMDDAMQMSTHNDLETTGGGRNVRGGAGETRAHGGLGLARPVHASVADSVETKLTALEGSPDLESQVNGDPVHDEALYRESERSWQQADDREPAEIARRASEAQSRKAQGEERAAQALERKSQSITRSEEAAARQKEYNQLASKRSTYLQSRLDGARLKGGGEQIDYPEGPILSESVSRSTGFLDSNKVVTTMRDGTIIREWLGRNYCRIVENDGVTTEWTGPDGSQRTTLGDGTVIEDAADGSRRTVRGDTKIEERPDGTKVTTTSLGSYRGIVKTEEPDGKLSLTRPDETGYVHFPDGAIEEWDTMTGDLRMTHYAADGTLVSSKSGIELEPPEWGEDFEEPYEDFEEPYEHVEEPYEHLDSEPLPEDEEDFE